MLIPAVVPERLGTTERTIPRNALPTRANLPVTAGPR